MATIKGRDGFLYLVEKYPRLDEPKIDTLWYPLQYEQGGKARLDRYTRHLEGNVVRKYTGSLYIDDDGKTYRLLSNKADFVGTEDVPPPKTRVKVRWVHGRWEKYLKQKGWVPA
ncbi:hypothetical protein GF380_01225 [Candidatus Uhrbacteria bacterium]|nr:hypothetical protein [Candidatus Uhrbacteria bacterium]